MMDWMLDWIADHTKIAAHILVNGVAFLILCLLAYGLVQFVQPVQAAPTVPDVCEQVAKVGDIVYYYCEPDSGPAFLTNSVGFMVLEP